MIKVKIKLKSKEIVEFRAYYYCEYEDNVAVVRWKTSETKTDGYAKYISYSLHEIETFEETDE